MDTADHPDVAQLRARLRGHPMTVADLPTLEMPPPPQPWSSAGVKKGPASLGDFARGIALCFALAAAPLLLLVAIGAWAVMPGGR